MDWQRKSKVEALALSELYVPEESVGNGSIVDVNSAAYVAELRKLLVKSKGTSYEGTLQKFIDIKNRELLESSGVRSPLKVRQPPTSTYSIAPGSAASVAPFTPQLRSSSPNKFGMTSSENGTMPSPIRLDISGLDNTLFVDHHEKLRCTIHSKDKEKWIREMSQPLERNLWKVTLVTLSPLSSFRSTLQITSEY